MNAETAFSYLHFLSHLCNPHKPVFFDEVSFEKHQWPSLEPFRRLSSASSTQPLSQLHCRMFRGNSSMVLSELNTYKIAVDAQWLGRSIDFSVDFSAKGLVGEIADARCDKGRELGFLPLEIREIATRLPSEGDTWRISSQQMAEIIQVG